MKNSTRQIISTYFSESIPNTTVLNVLSGVSRKYIEDGALSPREWKKAWSFVLTACLRDIDKSLDLDVVADEFLEKYPEKLMSLYGSLPFLFDCFVEMKFFDQDQERTKQRLAGISIAALKVLDKKIQDDEQ